MTNMRYVNAIKWDPQVMVSMTLKEAFQEIALANKLFDLQGKFLASCSDDMTLKVRLGLKT